MKGLSRKLKVISLLPLAVVMTVASLPCENLHAEDSDFAFESQNEVKFKFNVIHNGGPLSKARVDITEVKTAKSVQKGILKSTYFTTFSNDGTADEKGVSSPGVVEGVFVVPAGVKQVQVSVNKIGLGGEYSDRELKKVLGPFGPSASLNIDIVCSKLKDDSSDEVSSLARKKAKKKKARKRRARRRGKRKVCRVTKKKVRKCKKIKDDVNEIVDVNDPLFNPKLDESFNNETDIAPKDTLCVLDIKTVKLK